MPLMAYGSLFVVEKSSLDFVDVDAHEIYEKSTIKMNNRLTYTHSCLTISPVFEIVDCERIEAVFVVCKPVDSIISLAKLLIICLELSFTFVAMTTRFEVGVANVTWEFVGWWDDDVDVIIVVWWDWITWTELFEFGNDGFWPAEFALFRRSTAERKTEKLSILRMRQRVYLVNHYVFQDVR